MEIANCTMSFLGYYVAQLLRRLEYVFPGQLHSGHCWVERL